MLTSAVAILLVASPLVEATVPEPLSAPRLRPCCVFGYDLESTLGGTAVPARLANTVAYYHLGEHSYLPPLRDTEQNGLLYTCGGGFVDLAHVRDYADWTRYLYEQIVVVLGSAATFSLPYEGATRTVYLRSFSAPTDPAARKATALVLAQRLAFDLSIWHELVTWYDFRSVPIFSERVSAFSPEDLFSNTLGIILGAEAVVAAEPYDAAVDQAIAAALARLEPLTPRATRETFDRVDGIWWDHRQPVPSLRLVTRRNVGAEPVVQPWLVPRDQSPHCGHREVAPEVLRLATTTADGVSLDDLYELRFEVDVAAMPRFHRPPVETSYITQRDLAYVTERVRHEIRETFGPLADVPWSSSDEARRLSLDAAPPVDDCGAGDPDCARQRLMAVEGTRALTLELGSAITQAGGALTIVQLSTLGGDVDILPIRAVYDLVTGSYLLRAEAIHTPSLLSFCRKVGDAGPDDTDVPLPFINIVDPDCLAESSWGLRLDMLELIYDGRRNALGMRPIELGVVWNILANGFTEAFAESRLLWSLNLTPQLVLVPGRRADADLVVNSKVDYRQRFWDSRVELRLNAQVSEGVTHGASFVVEAGGELAYHLLLTSGSGADRSARVITIGGGGGVDYWATERQPLPPLNGRGVLLPIRGNQTDFWGYGILFVELSLSGLRL